MSLIKAAYVYIAHCKYLININLIYYHHYSYLEVFLMMNLQSNIIVFPLS